MVPPNLPTGPFGIRSRAAMYFYSTKNIVGSGLAVAGLAATFVLGFPVIWPLIVVGGYGVGALAAPAERTAVDLSNVGIDPSQIKRSLDKTMSALKGQVPEDVLAGAGRIHDGIITLLGHVSTLPTGSQEGFILQRMAVDYLPTSLQSYLSLPRNYANFHPVAGGKTARQILVDQLTLLNKQLDDVTDAVLKGDTDRLLANGRFLESRFGGDQALTLDGPTVPSPTPPPDVTTPPV